MENYLKNFYSTPNREDKYNTFFDGYTAQDSKLEDIRKELKKLQAQIDAKENEYAVKLNKSILNGFTPAENTPVFKYRSKNAGDLYYDGSSGMLLNNTPSKEEHSIYDLDTKNGNIAVVVGYAYNLAAVVTRQYKYTIKNDNTLVLLTRTYDILCPILEFNNQVYRFWNGHMDTITCKSSAVFIPSEVEAGEFVSNMYGIPRKLDITLGEFIGKIQQNKASEIIIKTAPEESVLMLLSIPFSEAKKINLLLDLSEDDYNLACRSKTLNEFLQLKDFFKSYAIEGFKTNAELIKLIAQGQEWKQTLEFYNVHYGYGSLYSVVGDLIRAFNGLTYEFRNYGDLFRKYYRFGAFCKYAVNGAVDQGFTSLTTFIQRLGDYLAMCNRYGSTPIKFTSDLNKLHDIMARNHRITFTEEQVHDFREKYDGFKSFTHKEYSIISPKEPQDLCSEGDSLGHCVAFYVKRVIDGECQVLFLRTSDKLNESLLTLELKENAITQAEGLLGRGPIAEEAEVIKAFAEKNGYTIAIDLG